MSVRSRPILAALATIAVALTAASFAGPASAAPYTRQPTLSINVQTPAVGATVVLTGAGYLPAVQVTLTLHTAVTTLGFVTPDASGGFTKSVTLPAGVSGTHTIVGAGTGTNDTASVTITIGSSTGGGGSGGGGGGLSSTGVAVVSIGTVGVALLIGGGLMLLAGRRRRVAA
jgi:hypothetical protein